MVLQVIRGSIAQLLNYVIGLGPLVINCWAQWALSWTMGLAQWSLELSHGLSRPINKCAVCIIVFPSAHLIMHMVGPS